MKGLWARLRIALPGSRSASSSSSKSWITPADLEQALEAQEKTGRKLGQIVVENGFILRRGADEGPARAVRARHVD